MTPLLNSTYADTEHEATLVELEYLMTEMLASSEFSLLVMVLAVWIFLRVYWFGLNIICYLTDGQTID